MILITALLIYFYLQHKFNSSEKAFNELREWRMGRGPNVESGCMGVYVVSSGGGVMGVGEDNKIVFKGSRSTTTFRYRSAGSFKVLSNNRFV